MQILAQEESLMVTDNSIVVTIEFPRPRLAARLASRASLRQSWRTKGGAVRLLCAMTPTGIGPVFSP